MTRLYFDANVYDKLRDDGPVRECVARAIRESRAIVVATPVILDELASSPFGGLPSFFPVRVEAEAVVVLGHARLGMARLGSGDVFKAHRGDSKQTKDAIIAQSAESLADVFVSEDVRCRTRLARIGKRCKALSYSEFRDWLVIQAWCETAI